MQSIPPSHHSPYHCCRRLLVRYYEMNHCKPEAVLVYRLEVPEAQVKRITSWEAEEIHKACRSMQPDEAYLPPLTYLCVSRTHHTRWALFTSLYTSPNYYSSGNIKIEN